MKHIDQSGIGGDNVKNAIASAAWIEGDCRHFDDAVSARIEETMRRIANGVAQAHGCEADVTYERVFVPLVNDGEATADAVSAANNVFVAENVTSNAPRIGGSEDFAQALTLAPGAFAFIGNGDTAPLHNSGFDFNDEALVPGVRWFCELVRKRLPVTSSPS